MSGPVRTRDPLADPKPLIRRVYSYVAYRLGDGADADDATSEVFERATRYRATYDPEKGDPLSWLLGIARRCVDSALTQRAHASADVVERPSGENLELEAVQRLTLAAAVGRLEERDRDLIALRYGADLTAAQIARIFEMRTNAVEVALHRALARLRSIVDEGGDGHDHGREPVRVQPRAPVSDVEVRATGGGA
jgi:RNA polymerase sigma factor (sigma-70 family)